MILPYAAAERVQRYALPCSNCGGRITFRYAGNGQVDLRCTSCKQDGNVLSGLSLKRLKALGLDINQYLDNRARSPMSTTAIVPKEESERKAWLNIVSRTLAQRAKLDPQELTLFATVCESLGLDPFRREIYAIRYKEGGPLSIVIGVDGYLRKAGETSLYDGMDTMLFAGKDGEWKELWDEDSPPYAAKASVYRKGMKRPITYIARYQSSFRASNDNWKTQPDVMLGINALKQALRRGFPEAFGDFAAQIGTMRSEGIPVTEDEDAIEGEAREIVNRETGEILDAQPIQQASRHTPEQPRHESSTSGDAATRFRAVAQKRGSAWWEPLLQKNFGATDFALLDDDEKVRAAELVEAEDAK